MVQLNIIIKQPIEFISFFQLQDFLTTYKNCNVNLVKIMEKICDTPFVEFDIYNVFEIKTLRANIRKMESTAMDSVLEMYKLIVIYLVIVYEGFEAHITQVNSLYRVKLLK